MWVVIIAGVIAVAILATHLIKDNTKSEAGGKSEKVENTFTWEFDLDINTEEISHNMARTYRIKKIDNFLADRGSPFTGHGMDFVDAEKRTGVKAELLVGLTLAESTCGTAGGLSNTNHNAWGMKGPQPVIGISAKDGYCYWPDWTSAIHGAADFVLYYWGPSSTPSELKGYCANGTGSGSSWNSRVMVAVDSIW
jgi:beta-N-acetylglucosaminidase